jgi:hypothetical protein
MARCGCASGSCSCLVTGAGGITVSGAGSQDNPFVVNGPVFTVGNSATADLVLTGSGTTGDPYRIVCNVHLTLDQLTDVTSPNPTFGHVLTYVNGTGWTNAIPQSGTPGAVLHDTSLKGDGTAAQVLGVLLDPTGGITLGPSGIKAGSGWTICTSGTRPPTPAAYDKIIESDTQAWGFWMPGTPGKWRMYDTKVQLYTPEFTTTSGTPSLGGGTANGSYMRKGQQCDYKASVNFGPNMNGGIGAARLSLPIQPAPSSVYPNSMWGTGFLHVSGWAYMPIFVQVGPGDPRVVIWAFESASRSIIWHLTNTTTGIFGQGTVPQSPGFPMGPNGGIEIGGTYWIDP